MLHGHNIIAVLKSRTSLTQRFAEASESEAKPKEAANDKSKESDKSKDLPTLQQEDIQINSHQRYLIMQKLHRDEPTVLEMPPMPQGKVRCGLLSLYLINACW